MTWTMKCMKGSRLLLVRCLQSSLTKFMAAVFALYMSSIRSYPCASSPTLSAALLLVRQLKCYFATPSVVWMLEASVHLWDRDQRMDVKANLHYKRLPGSMAYVSSKTHRMPLPFCRAIATSDLLRVWGLTLRMYSCGSSSQSSASSSSKHIRSKTHFVRRSCMWGFMSFQVWLSSTA